jgi:aspartate racemase
MKLMGLIGGTGWPSTLEYYRKINEGVNRKLGGLNFAKCILYSFNYAEIDELNKKNDLEELYNKVLYATEALEVAGAEGIILCANTLHIFADRLQAELDVPLIHIADATADAILHTGTRNVALLGTRITMEMDFYKDKLLQRGIHVIIPEAEERGFIHSTIMDELVKSVFLSSTRDRYKNIMQNLVNRGAQGIILGCTEIPLLISPEDSPVPLFNTLDIHSNAAVDFMVG